MKWIAALLCYASLLGGLGLSHTKKDDRGVFVSARELAASCQAMKDAVGEDYVLGPQQGGRSFARPAGTNIDMAPIGRCMGYIEGVADEFREHRPFTVGRDHTFTAGRGELPILVDAFLKRMAAHPEEADFAASTVLHEADNDVLRSCGDCSFGMLVYRPRKN